LSESRDGIARCRGKASMAHQIPKTAVAAPALSTLSLGMLIFVFRFDSEGNVAASAVGLG
jgi:hypothetical protein